MKKILAIMLVVFAISNVAQADYALYWSPVSGSSTGGAPITVGLFLQESGTDTNLFDNGAAGVDLQVDLTGVGSLATPVGNTNLNDGFDFALTNSTGTSATISQSSILGAGIGSHNLLLGTFTINATTNGSGTLTVTGLNGVPQDISLYDSSSGIVPLGSDIFTTSPATFNYNFTAVPEPTSIVFGGVLGISGLVTMYRRRKAVIKQN